MIFLLQVQGGIAAQGIIEPRAAPAIRE